MPEELLKIAQKKPFWKKKIFLLFLIFLVLFLVFITFVGVGIYKFGWENKLTIFATRLLPYPAAIATNKIITINDFQNQLDSAKTLQQRFYSIDFDNESGKKRLADLKKQLLDQLIENKIIMILAKKYDVKVENEEIEKQFNQIVNENQDLETVKKILFQNYKWTIEEFKQRIAEELLKEKLSDKVLLQLHVRHILIKVSPQDNENIWQAARGKTLSILEKIKNGEDFSKLASEFSDDEANKNSGGDLGFIARGRIIKEFEDAAFSLEPNKVSEPVRTQFGWHLIKVEDKKGFVNSTFQEWLEEQKKTMKIWKFI